MRPTDYSPIGNRGTTFAILLHLWNLFRHIPQEVLNLAAMPRTHTRYRKPARLRRCRKLSVSRVAHDSEELDRIGIAPLETCGIRGQFSPRMFYMNWGWRFRAGAALALFLAFQAAAQEAPRPSAARILLVPWKMVSGDRATLAVLDVDGRLTPNVTIEFSNGDRIKTDATGRALFVAPLNPGILYASIHGRPGRVRTTVLSPQEAAASGVEVSMAPRMASLKDRFAITGGGFCGDADKNEVTIGKEKALVLASSPLALQVLPPPEQPPGTARVEVACSKRNVGSFKVVFLSLELEADASPLAPGQVRTVRVHVTGTTEKVPLLARNLSPQVVQLSGGKAVRLLSSGGEDNEAKLTLTGLNHGKMLISIRLVPHYARPRS